MSIDPNNLSETAVLTFAEEFDGTSLDLSTWNTAYPWSAANGGTNTANAEEQWYVRADYAPTAGLDVYEVENGVLDINAMPTPDGQRDDVEGYDYVSGMINTHGSFSQTYGYFEMRADIPEGQGLWPAFWLLQDDLNWPPELDVMEVIGSSPDDVITSVHFDDGGHKLLNKVTTIPGVSDGMATFGMDWQPDEIVWYVDGVEVFRADTPDDMHDPMYLLANLAVGGTWPGSPTSESIPATMSIDYIRAYAERPEGETPAPAPADPVEEEEPVVDETPAPAPADPVEEEEPVVDETPAPAPADPVEEEPVVDEAPAPAPADPVEEEEPVVDETPAPAPADPVEEEEPVVDETPAPAPADPVEEEPVVDEAPAPVGRSSDWLERLKGRDWLEEAGHFDRDWRGKAAERIEAGREEAGDWFGRFTSREAAADQADCRFGIAAGRAEDRFAVRNEIFDDLAERFGRFERGSAAEGGRDLPAAVDAFDFSSLDMPSVGDVQGLVSSFLDVA